MREGGDTYKSGVTLLEDQDTLSIPTPVAAQCVEKCPISNYCFISFDVDTTFLTENNEIVQLSSVNTNSCYNSYLAKKNQISARSSNVTGLSLVLGKLLVRGKVMPSVTLHECLENFLTCLNSTSTKPVILYGHNVQFDAKALLRSCQQTGFEKTLLENVVGFTDTLPLLKSVMPNRAKYIQSAIVEDLLGEPYDAHRVEPDLMTEHSFTLQWFGSYNNFITHRNVRMPTFQPIARKRLVSTGMIVKMASSGLEFKHLAVAFKRGEKAALFLY